MEISVHYVPKTLTTEAIEFGVKIIPFIMLLIAVPIVLTEQFNDKRFFGVALVVMTVLTSLCGFIDRGFSIIALLLEIVIVALYTKSHRKGNEEGEE
jgi:drug/metabolite transporter (DMT)-like permease